MLTLQRNGAAHDGVREGLCAGSFRECAFSIHCGTRQQQQLAADSALG